MRHPLFTRVRCLRLVIGIGLVLNAAAADPVVRMFVPGFTVQELPVKLGNQNNLRFAPDGTLTSLGYDGRIWRLRDTNGDGLEDTAEPFWDRPTLSVPLGMAWSTHGLLVSSQGKVSLLCDRDGDGKADLEEVVTSGWPATDVGSGGVDATAVTLDREGKVYFGLLVADYSNAYRLRPRSALQAGEIAWLKQHGRWREPVGPEADRDEFSLYDLNSPRGTIQQFDPRTKERTTLATGIRVPVALAFNVAGDLFNTDQEGETWMPNGNPLDELNHIVAGRNYGFPPRHATWLPDLASEPPVVGFGPQHQSACGLVFNEPHAAVNSASPATNRGPIPLPSAPSQGRFGPTWWKGDAFVAGESRGKIWRVRLVKTPHGYVGKSQAIARLSMLTLDLAISPHGELYVCCHSGPPDWGTGPQGEGKILKITHVDPGAPQPVAVGPASSTEVRIAFDAPLDPGVTELRRFATGIEFGEYVTAGDQFETLKPPYAVVEQQDATPRGRLAVRAAALQDHGRTLVLTTDPHPLAVNYALTISGVKREGGKGAGEMVTLDYNLSGVDGHFSRLPPRQASPAPMPLGVTSGMFSARVSTPDIGIAQFLAPSLFLGSTNSFAGDLAKWNNVVLTGRLRLPSDAQSIRFDARQPFQLALGTNRVWMSAPHIRGRQFGLEWSADRVRNDPVFELQADTRRGSVRVAYRTDPLGRWVPLPVESGFPLWAPAHLASSGTDSRAPAKPRGDWEHGRELFIDPKLNCAQCHRVRGEGGLAGPDLSNLIHRDVRSVERDIREPGATLHPDYVTYLAELKNGDTATGFVRAHAEDQVRLFDATGKETVIARADLANLHPTGQSLMPSGLLDGRGENDVRDLLTFLLWEPPARNRTEIERVLGSTAADPARAVAGAEAPNRNAAFQVVLVASKQDHGPGQHDYPRWQEKWMRVLGTLKSDPLKLETAWQWPSPDQFASANVLVFYCWNHDWSAARYAQLDAFQQRGGGVVLLHSAVIADEDPEALAERIGFSAQPRRVSYRHMPFDLKFVRREHPLLRGLPETLSFLDEPYWPLVGDPARVNVLATAEVDGVARPLVWTFERGRGRVFASILGHYFWTLDDPLYRLLVLRGMAWAGGAELERLTAAALIEAVIK